MPMKFVTRTFKSNAYYHVFNRGMGGREIFLDKEDYETFLYYLEIYTAPVESVAAKFPKLSQRLIRNNLNEEVKLISYVLMPNHFHLILKQKSARALPRLLKQVSNAYTTYFKAKYKSLGGVMQGRYRAVLIESEFLLVQMVRFVHRNPVSAGFSLDPRTYVWSSINDHSEENELLNSFGGVEEWDRFHLDLDSFEANLQKIKQLTIDS